MTLAAIVLLTAFLGGQATAAKPDGHSTYCRIVIAEMSDDLAVFEVFLPQSEAHRKGVVHTVVDDEGIVIVTQKFSTANGHYKIAMIASYIPGREYTFRVDGKYNLSFRFDPSS